MVRLAAFWASVWELGSAICKDYGVLIGKNLGDWGNWDLLERGGEDGVYSFYDIDDEVWIEQGRDEVVSSCEILSRCIYFVSL